MRSRIPLAAAAVLLAVLGLAGSSGPRFYPDDPLWAVPEPRPTPEVQAHKLSDIFDYLLYTFGSPEEQHEDAASGVIPAQAVNTLGEVPDSQWFTNRIDRRELSIEELRRGPGDERPPAEGAWRIVSAKTEGLTPGFVIEDSGGERYLMKFDPKTNPEMASGADILGTRFFHALGYWVPQNYIVYFSRDRLRIEPGTKVSGKSGAERDMRPGDIEAILERVPRRPDGTIRALASRYIQGKPLGGFRYHGTRKGDANDVVPHEHRRDLRGLYVFCSWLGHDDSRSINTLDMLVEEDGKKFVRHHLIDFGSLLGSASEEPNSARGGNQYLYEPGLMWKQILTLGIYVPRWYRHDYKEIPAVGRFEHEIYRPDEWRPEYRNPAFSNRLPDDTFWAAKKVMRFSDEAIREMVRVAEYSDPKAEAWIVECLLKRRDKIGREYFSRVLPLDGFRIRDGRLAFEHLGEKYGFSERPKIAAVWSWFDNLSGERRPIEAAGLEAPAAVREAKDGFAAVELSGSDAAKTVTVFLRLGPDMEVVGVERTW